MTHTRPPASLQQLNNNQFFKISTGKQLKNVNPLTVLLFWH